MSDPSSVPSEQQKISIPVTEEKLSVSTHTVDLGRGVRIHKTVQSHPVTIDETLAREESAVRHVAIDRLLEQGETLPQTRYEGDLLIVPIFEEVLVVERRMRLKEELHITRIRREESFVQTVMVKTEQVDIEHFDDSDHS